MTHQFVEYGEFLVSGERSDVMEEEHGEELRGEPLLCTAACHWWLGQGQHAE